MSNNNPKDEDFDDLQFEAPKDNKIIGIISDPNDKQEWDDDFEVKKGL